MTIAVDMPERRWVADEDETNLIGMKPKDKLFCPFCRPRWWQVWKKKSVMKPVFGNVFSFDISVPPDMQDKIAREDRTSHAMDIWQTCLRCKYHNVHGVPLHKDEFREKMDFIINRAVAAGLVPKGETLVEN